MSRIAGQKRGETYPQPREVPLAPVSPEFASAQSATPYTEVVGNPPTVIISTSITLQSGSSVKVEGMASFIGSVAAGKAILSSPSIAGVVSQESFGVGDTRTCNYLAVTGPQPAGLLTIGLQVQVTGSAGAQIDNAGPTTLTLTEILA
jgi:hypothetical protein